MTGKCWRPTRPFSQPTRSQYGMGGAKVDWNHFMQQTLDIVNLVVIVRLLLKRSSVFGCEPVKGWNTHGCHGWCAWGGNKSSVASVTAEVNGKLKFKLRACKPPMQWKVLNDGTFQSGVVGDSKVDSLQCSILGMVPRIPATTSSLVQMLLTCGRFLVSLP